jgi:L-cysteine/cystine lyase
MPDDEKLAAVRDGLPALAAGIYLNTGSLGPVPAETAAAMAELAERELRVGRAHPADVDDALARIDEARASFAAVLTADIDDVVVTHSTTEGLNIAAWSIAWRPGDGVVTTTDEHPGGVGPLYVLRDRLGVGIRFVDAESAGDEPGLLAAFDEAIDRSTRLVLISHVLWTTGRRLPVGEITELAHARGALVVVDGAQAAGAIPIDVGGLAVDAYAVPGQKWLLGPEGTGALYVSPAAADRMAMTHGGWHTFSEVDSRGSAVAHGDARRFQVAGLHGPSVLGAARSVSWLTMYVGLDWIYTRGASLARRAAERLSGIRGVEVLTPLDRMATLVSFRTGGWTADAVVDELGARSFAVTRAIPASDACRLSVGFFNTDAEIERVARVVELLAEHTPESVPSRRTLAVLGADE